MPKAVEENGDTASVKQEPVASKGPAQEGKKTSVLRRANGKKKRVKRKKRSHTLPKVADFQAQGASDASDGADTAPVAVKAEETADNDSSDKKDGNDLEQAQSSGENASPGNVDIDYEPEEAPSFNVPGMSAFAEIFEAFKNLQPKEEVDANADADGEQAMDEADMQQALFNAGFRESAKFEEEDEDGEGKLTRKQLRKKNRLTVAQLKQVVRRPDVVEMHDVNALDPKTLVHLKATRNTVPVPRHWLKKRKYMQGKRGVEKKPYQLPDFIKRTGIVEMRQALDEKDKAQTLKSKMRNKVRPRMGNLDLDYQKMHDAFFRWQTKPKMSIHGDIYFEGKEFETQMPSKRPGDLSKELKEALGMPIEQDAAPVPPPWLLHMQRFGPPPSYPNLSIPGLNAPLPKGASYGTHPGAWGKPPVDAKGAPLYGDPFGEHTHGVDASAWEDNVDKTLWGQLESESEDSESEDSDSGSDDDSDEEDGLETPGGIVSQIPSGTSSVSDEALDLRKRQNIEKDMEDTTQQSLYKVIPQRSTQDGGKDLMGSAHTYDLSAAVPGTLSSDGTASNGTSSRGVNISLDNPADLGRIESSQLEGVYSSQKGIDSTASTASSVSSEALSEDPAKSSGKRKKSQRTEKMKRFKF